MAIKDIADKITQKEIAACRKKTLDWYDQNGRELPWRYKNGATPNPYHVWLSEIMCQQTTVQAVIPYYTKFLSTWPTIQDLANAENDDVMAAWAGLGYYARARNLHKCAKLVTDELNGQFPTNQKSLKELPGIGDYTSAAIASIAFNEPATVMDGNIERIMARFFLLEAPLPKSKSIFKEYTARFFDGFNERTGDFAQALMDIGSSICTPKNPKCPICPLKSKCIANKQSVQEKLPVKIKAKNRPQKHGEVYWVMNDKGEVLFHKRPEKGLLAGMIGLPTSSWEVQGVGVIRPEILSDTKIIDSNQSVNHVFTHFDLTLSLKMVVESSDIKLSNEYVWHEMNEMQDKLPTVFRKPYVQFVLECKK